MSSFSSSLLKTKEFTRAKDLLELELDYAGISKEFDGLVKLAAHVAGTEISLLNLIDSYTQWTVSGHGFPVGQTPRENSVCQYTLFAQEHFEVKDLSLDDRFSELAGIKDGPQLRYYFGIPLKSNNGQSIGTLCVLDTAEKNLTPDKIDLLKGIAEEIVSRLRIQRQLQAMQHELTEAKEAAKRAAHDIRGPIGGIIGLSKMIIRKAGNNTIEEVLKLNQHIYTSATSLLELADEILYANKKAAAATPAIPVSTTTLQLFKEKLLKLYKPQAQDKAIQFEVEINPDYSSISFPNNKLLQVIGNLISNAFKFTPPLGSICVNLDFMIEPGYRVLHILVTDNGIGLTEEQLASIRHGNAFTTSGTDGEEGFGLGLQLVKHLLDILNGSMTIQSVEGEGTSFELKIPVGTVTPIH